MLLTDNTIVLDKELYDAKLYWSNRLNKFGMDSFVGVGHIRRTESDNRRSYEQASDIINSVIDKHIGGISGKTLIDIGCGTSYYATHIPGIESADYTGLDITSTLFGALQHRYPRARYVLSDISDESFDTDAKYDIVMAIDILLHIIDESKYELAVANLLSLVSPGGICLITVYNPIGHISQHANLRWYDSLHIDSDMFIIIENIPFRDGYLVVLQRRCES